jgi:hypothetical protein
VLTLALKLGLTPVLIGGATLVGRRWGGAVSGWSVALPLTSGPVSAFLVAEHDARFGARAAVGSLAGVVAEAAFCLAYAWNGRHGRLVALACATGGFAGAGAAVQALRLTPRLPLPLLAVAVAAALVLVASSRALPQPAAVVHAAAPPPRWDLPARAIVTTALVVLLTGVATLLGARLTGLLSVFPLYVAVLAAFAHRADGAAAATAVLRGVLVGLYSFVAFFFVLAALLGRIPAVAAFACASAAALGSHAATLRLVRLH